MKSNSSNQDAVVMFTARKKAELVPLERNATPLGPKEVAGHTIISLISSGTEAVGCYAGTHFEITDKSYPMETGYAAVFQVEEVGSEVKSVAKGDMVFCCRGHRSHQRTGEENVVKVPAGLAPEVAVFARMIKIPMPAFVRTGVRPPEILAVTGLGAVGLMAAQLGQHYGYQVLGCDPSEQRRRIAEEHGIQATAAKVPLEDPAFKKKVGFGLDCSGHEQAVLDLCNVVRVWGEVAMVGVPWVARTPRLAQEIMHSVFYNYVDLKSGWEGQMPGGASIHSGFYHHTAAMRWLAEGQITIKTDTFRRASPADPQKQYQDILHGRLNELTVLFDWRQL